MWVLVVQGMDDDYAAAEFEKSDWTVEEGLEDTEGLESYLNDECGCEATVSAYEFFDVDPEFVDLIESIFIDYDDSKQSNFYCSWED